MGCRPASRPLRRFLNYIYRKSWRATSALGSSPAGPGAAKATGDGSVQVPAPHSQSRKAAGIHESAAATRVPAQTFPGGGPHPHLRAQRAAPALLSMRTRRLPLPSRTMSPRMLYAPAQAPPCPSPTLASVSTLLLLFPRGSVVPNDQVTLPDASSCGPASDPGVRAPVDVRKLLKGQRTATPPSQLRMPPTTFPSVSPGFQGLAGICTNHGPR